MQRLEQYEVEFEDSHVATRFKIPELGSPPNSFPSSSLPSVFTSPTPDRSEPGESTENYDLKMCVCVSCCIFRPPSVEAGYSAPILQATPTNPHLPPD